MRKPRCKSGRLFQDAEMHPVFIYLQRNLCNDLLHKFARRVFYNMKKFMKYKSMLNLCQRC